MPAPYATPSNVTDFVDMFSYMNAVTTDTTGIFGLLVLVSIFVITFILNAGKEVEVAFAVSAWVTMISAILLSMLEGSYGYLIPGGYVSATVTIACISVIILYVRQR